MPVVPPTIHLVMKPLQVKVMFGKRYCFLLIFLTILRLIFSAPFLRAERLRKSPVQNEPVKSIITCTFCTCCYNLNYLKSEISELADYRKVGHRLKIQMLLMDYFY